MGVRDFWEGESVSMHVTSDVETYWSDEMGQEVMTSVKGEDIYR